MPGGQQPHTPGIVPKRAWHRGRVPTAAGAAAAAKAAAAAAAAAGRPRTGSLHHPSLYPPTCCGGEYRGRGGGEVLIRLMTALEESKQETVSLNLILKGI